MALITNQSCHLILSPELGGLSTHLEPNVSNSQMKGCRVLAENDVSILGVSEGIKRRGGTQVECGPYSGGRSTSRKDAPSIGRVNCTIISLRTCKFRAIEIGAVAENRRVALAHSNLKGHSSCGF